MSIPDSAEFARLFDADAYRIAWSYACRLCAGRADAEDLLQETLLMALGKLKQLRDPAAFRGWLLAIMRRRWLSERRKKLLTLEDSYAFQNLRAAQPAACPIELADALKRLPPRQREAIELLYFSGLRVEELAVVLAVTPHAASQLLGRARQSLRRLLGPQPAMTTCTEVQQ